MDDDLGLARLVRKPPLVSRLGHGTFGYIWGISGLVVGEMCQFPTDVGRVRK